MAYTDGNKDDIKTAIDGLIQFTHNFCMNCEETDKQNNLVFRCKGCNFNELGYCTLKRTINKYGTDEQKQNGSCMSR